MAVAHGPGRGSWPRKQTSGGFFPQKPVTAVCRRGRRASLAPCEGSRRPCWGLCVLPHHFSVSLSLPKMESLFLKVCKRFH